MRSSASSLSSQDLRRRNSIRARLRRGMRRGMRRGSRHVLGGYAELPFFASWTQSDLVRLDRTATQMQFGPGEVISRDLGTGGEFIVLLVGQAQIEGGSRDGDRLSAGDHFGDVGMLVAGRCAITLRAETNVRALVISPADFGALLATAPSFGKAIANRLAHRVAQLVDGSLALEPAR